MAARNAIDRIRASAHNGLTRPKIEALLGRKLTAEEKTAYDKARGIYELELRKRRETRKYEHLSGAEKSRRHNEKAASIDDALDEARKRINWERRNAAEKSLSAWMRTYCMEPECGFIDDEPSPLLERVLTEMETGIGDASIPYHLQVARGYGKTSYTEGAVAYAIATGKRRYVVIVSAKADDAANIMDDVFTLFESGEKFAVDYPDIALPIRLLNGGWRRRQTYRGKATRFSKSRVRVSLPYIVGEDGVTPTPAAGAILTARGFDGKMRGQKRGAMRPDLLVLDDVQDEDEAANDEIVSKKAKKIRGSFLNLGGRKRLSVIMTSTPIEADDLSEQFAKDPAWKTTKFKAFISWPVEWERHGMDGLWGEYVRIYRREVNLGSAVPSAKATAFYLQNRSAMDEGAVVLNERRFDSRTQASGVQALMDKYFEIGADAFAAEMQMEPRRFKFAFEISARMILARVRRDVRPWTQIDNHVLTIAATDINPSYALSTTVVSFDVNSTALVVAYHVTKISISDAANDTEYHRRVFDALTAHGREIAEATARHGVTLDGWGIDAGGKQFDAVTAFAKKSAELVGIRATAMTGRAGRTWNPNVKTRVRAAINETVLCRDERGREWMPWNTDYHKESMQKSWATETGAPGGISVFDGGFDHGEFAQQIANEKLVSKRKLLDGRFEYKWRTKEPHDFLDCLGMCYALAGAKCLSGDSTMFGERTHKRKRRVYVG